MKKFVVQSLPIQEVIQSLAKQMNTDYEVRCDHYSMNIPDDFGVGTINGIDFENGMGIIQYDCKFKDAVELQFIVNKIHPLKFLFCLEGSLTHHFQDDDILHEIKEYQNAIVASSKLNGHILRFDKDEIIKVNSLEISRAEFRSEKNCELLSLEKPMQDLFNDINAENTFYYEGYYSLELSDVFDGMQKFDQQDFLKRMFFEGKSYLILTRQITQYQDDLKDVSDRSLLRRSEIKQVRNAAKYIEENIADLASIQDLAIEVGLNTNKLQIGFNTLYGQSVNQYIQDQRLKLAKKLIDSTDMNMSEITNAIGLNSRSYFSKVFKEAYGISPSDLKRKNKEHRLELKKERIED